MEFQLKAPNLNQICILGFSQLALKMGVIDLDLQGHLAISTPNSTKRHSASLLYVGLGLLLYDCIEFRFNFQLKTKFQNAIVSRSRIKLKSGKEQTLQK